MDSKNLLVVIHDTSLSKSQLFSVIQAPNNGVYYHAIIDEEGEIIYCVDPKIRINASFPSSFKGEQVNGSVDKFAYHVCLINQNYTNKQYISLAWLCKQLQVKEDRIVGHYEIDLSGLRDDAISLDKKKLISLLTKVQFNKQIIWEL
jgi:N-acetyl-anhydromuramyl-L-alanine amidase AmpD